MPDLPPLVEPIRVRLVPMLATGTPVQSGSGQDGTTSATQVLATSRVITAGAHLVCLAAAGGAGTTVSSISGGSLTWTLGPTVLRSTIIGIGSGVAQAPVGLASGTNITVTWNSATAARHFMLLYEVNGLVSGNPYDATASGSSSFTATTTPSVTGGGVTSQADEILFGAVSQNIAGTYTAGTGYTLLDNLPRTTVQTLATEYQIVSATGTYSAAFTTPSSQGVILIFALKGTAAAVVKRRTLLGVGV